MNSFISFDLRLKALLPWKQRQLCLNTVIWAPVLTWASCIRTTGMWSLLPSFGVAMLDRVMASSSSSMTGRYSVPLSVVCDPKPLSKAKPRLLWDKELCLSFRDSDRKTTRWHKEHQYTYRLYFSVTTIHSNGLTMIYEYLCDPVKFSGCACRGETLSRSYV